MEDFLGTGWKFPVALNPQTNKVDMSGGELSIVESIELILNTGKGERVMSPDFGASLQKLAFDSLGSGVTSEVAYEVKNALRIWEPRIRVIDIKVLTDASEMNRLNIDIDYEVISSNNRHNLVYPFYMERG